MTVRDERAPAHALGGAERRIFVRIECDMPLIVSVDAVSGRPPRNLAGRIKNVSDGGVLLFLPECLPQGTRVTLIHLPPESRPNMPGDSVESRVAWSTEAPNAGRQFPHGVEFLSPAAHLVTTLLALKA